MIISRPIPLQRYVYRARCERVIDGDTMMIRIDLGMHCERVERIRLSFINAPELRTPEGIAASLWAKNWVEIARLSDLRSDWPLLIETTKLDDYGRFLGTIWRRGDGMCLNEDMVAAGQAVRYPKVVPSH